MILKPGKLRYGSGHWSWKKISEGSQTNRPLFEGELDEILLDIHENSQFLYEKAEQFLTNGKKKNLIFDRLPLHFYKS